MRSTIRYVGWMECRSSGRSPMRSRSEFHTSEMSTLTTLSILALSPLLLPAQDVIFSTDVRVVNLIATVRDAQGHLVPNLTKDDFTLEEDGQPQTIRYFSRESGLPLTLGLLVDTSISQKRVLAEERTASYRF